MSSINEIEEIERVISTLKELKKDILKTDKLSLISFACNGTPRAREKAATNLNWQCMILDKQRKAVWKAIKKAKFLEVDTGEREYHPSAFHSYKG